MFRFPNVSLYAIENYLSIVSPKICDFPVEIIGNWSKSEPTKQNDTQHFPIRITKYFYSHCDTKILCLMLQFHLSASVHQNQHSMLFYIWNCCIIYLHIIYPLCCYCSRWLMGYLSISIAYKMIYTRRWSNENCLCHVIKSKTFHNAANEKWNM